jgi:hypothetical protein
MNKTDVARLLVAAFAMLSLFLMGAPTSYLLFLGVFLVLLFFFRAKIYGKIDGFLSKKFQFFAQLPPWGKKALVFLVFLFLYFIFKQAAFEFLKLFGLDLQKELADSIYSSMP